jgi:hypothetical protein
MPIFQQDLDRHLERREPADGGDDQADGQAKNENENENENGIKDTLPIMSPSPDQGEHSHSRRSRPLHLHRDHRPSQPLSRKVSEESIRTELCEGPVPDSPLPSTPPPPPPPPFVQRSHHNDSSGSAIYTYGDRAELIERLKRGESPPWISHLYVRSLPLYCRLVVMMSLF